MKENERLAALREQMQLRGISMYVVNTSDAHASEYVGDYFKTREYLTGFTGSAGTAVVTPEEAGLWTDGRYFVQAQKELEGSEFVLYRSGERGVPTVEEYIASHLPREGVLGFDGKCMTVSAYQKFRRIVREKRGTIAMDEDLVGIIWNDRPAIANGRVWLLPRRYAGETAESKIFRIRRKMDEEQAQGHIISNLCDIAWILNLRGSDIPHVPVFLSYLYITMDDVVLYANTANWDPEVLSYLERCEIRIRPYDAFYEDIRLIKEELILLDENVVNGLLYRTMPRDAAVIAKENISTYMRSVKNDGEIANSRIAHRKDGVAVTKLLYRLKKNIGKTPMDEHMIAEELLRLRKEQEHFLDMSFDTICAYGSNAAMMHYRVTEEQNARIEPEGFLLIDSGAHYLEGTTDVTRTVCMGPVTEQMRRMYTLVLQGHLRLAMAKFPEGCCGQNLDILARGPLWTEGLDYRCGTGHGVGHILNVHEGPNMFRWKIPEEGKVYPLEPGMITSDEPGYYEPGAYGIRIESELLCVEDGQTEYGRFLSFENLTCVPIDLDAVDPSMLFKKERAYLNAYHEKVYETLSPYLEEEECMWLKEVTRPI